MSKEPIVVSTDPLILLFEGFSDADEVSALLKLAKVADDRDDPSKPLYGEDSTDREKALVSDVESRIGLIVGCKPHEEESRLLILRKKRDPAPCHGRASPPRGISGLHVDANGDQLRRFASALLYLSSPTGGGQTVFPLAVPASASTAGGSAMSSAPIDRRKALEASHALLKRKVYHTANSSSAGARALGSLVASVPSACAPPVGASFVASEHGVAIRPIAGNLLVFWTRDPHGISARSWHAGESVPYDSPCDKWLLRSFKEIPVATFEDFDARAKFIERSRADHVRSKLCSANGNAATESTLNQEPSPRAKRRRR